MDIRYLKEHCSCNYYQKHIDSGFTYHKVDKGFISHTDRTIKNQIIILLEGRLQIYCNEFNIILEAGNMLFIHKSSILRDIAIDNCAYLILSFDNICHLCIKTSLSELASIKKKH